MHRVFNFSAGPAMIPEEVMQKAQAEFMDWNEMGMSVMEISHRSKEFVALAEEITQDFRDILQIPDNYHILFLHGGARTQFAMIPMNLLDKLRFKKAAYIRTGIWSQLSLEEAQRYCEIDIIADSEANKYTTIPEFSEWKNVDPKSAYLYYVDNETVNGIEFADIPDSPDVPLVCDMSSNILSRPFDVSKFGIIFACAQKNLGMAGITAVIVRDDLLTREPLAQTPSMLRYRTHAEMHSMLNTSPTYPWYMLGLVLKWVKKQGGVGVLAERNQRKAEKLYQYIDQSDFYSNPIDPKYRSRMNVIFTTPSESLDQKFVEAANKAGLPGLKGHRFLGGLRASIYNAMPEAGVDALLALMHEFERRS